VKTGELNTQKPTKNHRKGSPEARGTDEKERLRQESPGESLGVKHNARGTSARLGQKHRKRKEAPGKKTSSFKFLPSA